MNPVTRAAEGLIAAFENVPDPDAARILIIWLGEAWPELQKQTLDLCPIGVLRAVAIEAGRRDKCRRQPFPALLRAEVLASGMCATCGTPDNLTVDHIVPVAKGGGNARENLQALCIECNSRKRDRMP